MDRDSTIKTWQKIPLQDQGFNHLYVIRDQNGGIVATVQDQYAEAIESFPELFSASRDILHHLKKEHPTFSQNSLLSKLETALAKIRLRKDTPQT